jgi:hypothetical protein
MKAIVQDKYGSAEVLEARDIDKPEIADDEVLVRVRPRPSMSGTGSSEVAVRGAPGHRTPAEPRAGHGRRRDRGQSARCRHFDQRWCSGGASAFMPHVRAKDDQFVRKP